MKSLRPVFETVEARVMLTNNAPVLVHTVLAGYTERDTTQANLAALVSSLTGGISDADPGAVKGVAIVNVDQAHGTVQFSANNGSTWTNVGAVSTSNALLLPADANTRVRLVPTDAYLGTISDAITLRAWDQTSGVADAFADTTVNGGSTAFSTATDTVSMTIDPAVGSQVRANSDSTGTHTPVGTALDGQGNSVVAWMAYNGTNTNLFAQSYQCSGTANGAQFQVNPASSSVSSAAVAMNAGGTSIFVWSTYSSSTYTVYSQRFNNNTGAAIDAAPVSLFSDPYVKNLSVGIATNGGFVVSFTTSNASAFTNNDFLVSNQVLTATNQATTGGTYYAVLACKYDANDVFQNGTPITVATTTSPSYFYSSCASVAGDGSFVVAWETVASSTYQLQALRYTATGNTPPYEHAAASPGCTEHEHWRDNGRRTSGRQLCRRLERIRQQHRSDLGAALQLLAASRRDRG